MFDSILPILKDSQKFVIIQAENPDGDSLGSSLAFVVMMYACSYVFNFCYWHKIVITYDLFVLLYILLIRYTNIGECSDGLLLTIHYILAGIFIALIWYVKKRCKITD